MLENKLLSKVLNEDNYFIMGKYNVNNTDFAVHSDVYVFIKKYVTEFGHVPDYRTVVEKFSDFEYMGEVVDAFPFLCKELKARRGLRQSFSFLQNEVPRMFDGGKNKQFLEQLKTEVDTLYDASRSISHVGSNYANNGTERMNRYYEGKENRGHTVIPSPYDGLNEILDMELTDYLLLQAFSNVGKSWVASQFGVHAWSEGFGVLHYSPELSLTQQEARNDTLMGHFNNTKLRNGELDNEGKYEEFLKGFSGNENPYIIKTMEHMPDGLTLETIESDIQQNPNIRLVIIDGFNLITHGRGKLDRNAMTQTSRRLRQIFGRYKVLGIVVHQVNAEEERENKKGQDDDEFAERIPRPASILGYSETLAVVQDASHILSLDAVDGMGALQLVKTRGEGKDSIINLSVDFNMGYIREVTPVDYF